MRKFWINTKKDAIIKLTLVHGSLNDVIDGNSRLYFGLKECSLFEFFMFDVFRINLKAKREDRYKWLKFFIKTKVAHSILAIASAYSRIYHRTP